MESTVMYNADAEARRIACQNLEAAREKDRKKVPVHVMDRQNTILFVDRQRDKEKAVQDFLRKTKRK